MEKELPDEQPLPQYGGGGETDGGEPTVVLPNPNMQGMAGGLQGIASTITPIMPQPILSPQRADGDDLAARVEAALAEDGRFTALVPGLSIGAEDGTVRLSGTVPSVGQRQSLLSAVGAVSGVTKVEDGLSTA